jgi:hypothetical protein
LEELWAEIDGYPNYIVSNYGEVVSLRTDQRLRARPNADGYLRVALSREGVSKDHYVHQLVAKAFFGSFRNGMHVSHVNGDKENNSTHNLRLRSGKVGTAQRDNEQEPWGQRVRIIETGQVFRTARECARHIGGDYGSVYACLRGRRNRHLGYTFEYYGE